MPSENQQNTSQLEGEVKFVEEIDGSDLQDYFHLTIWIQLQSRSGLKNGVISRVTVRSSTQNMQKD